MYCLLWVCQWRVVGASWPGSDVSMKASSQTGGWTRLEREVLLGLAFSSFSWTLKDLQSPPGMGRTTISHWLTHLTHCFQPLLNEMKCNALFNCIFNTPVELHTQFVSSIPNYSAIPCSAWWHDKGEM